MSLRVASDHFAGRGGLALRYRSWIPDDARRTLAIVHGLAEHSQRYDHVARYFARSGYAVHSFDQRGHGESEGPRMYTPDFPTLLDDIELFLEHIGRVGAPGPLHLLGHSMGGLEVATLLVERGPDVAAAVLSGPALASSPALGRATSVLVGLLSRVAPRLRVPASLDPEGLSRDPEVVSAYMADPLVDKRYSARLVAALIAAIAAIEGRGGDVGVPLLIVHGAADPICPIEGSLRFAADLRPPGSEHHPYAELRHEVLNEPEREVVLADIAQWLDKHGASA